MVTCSLNGGAGERHPKNSVSENSRNLGSSNRRNHGDGVVCRTNDEEKHNGAGSNDNEATTPMVKHCNCKYILKQVHHNSLLMTGIMSKHTSCAQFEIRLSRSP